MRAHNDFFPFLFVLLLINCEIKSVSRAHEERNSVRNRPSNFGTCGGMISEPQSSMANEANVAAERPVLGTLPNKKSQGKIPKKIHKAEREKLKRDHLNELFFELGYALEPSRQNNGKACILGDATKLLRDLITQVESLRKENAELLSESHYVTVEKDELRDENTILVTEIEKLQNELTERRRGDPILQSGTETTTNIIDHATNEAPPVAGPVYVIPVYRDLQPYENQGSAVPQPRGTTNVSRPQARYPGPEDSWTLQLLPRNPVAAQDGFRGTSSNGLDTTSS